MHTEQTEVTSNESTGHKAAIAARAPDAETAAFELALAALPSRTTRLAKPRTTTILDCGDWVASACPGGFAAVIERMTETTLTDVETVIAIGKGETSNAVDALFGNEG